MSSSDIEKSEIDLMKILSAIWHGRWLLLVWTVLSFALAVVYLHVATRVYSVSMVLMPAHNFTSTDRLSSGLGGLASLAGVRLGQGGAASPFEIYLMRINTHETAAAMMSHKDIASAVFPQGWDERSGTWQEQHSMFHDVVHGVSWLVSGTTTPWSPPDAVMMEKFIKEQVGVDRDKDTGSVTLSLDNKDPQLAVRFLLLLNSTVDEGVRKSALAESAEYIAYISKQLKLITVSEQREALTTLLSDEEKKSLLAGSGLPYAAQTFSAPYVPNAPSKPSAVLSVFIAVLLGLGFGIIHVLLAERFRFLSLVDIFRGRAVTTVFDKSVKSNAFKANSVNESSTSR